MDALELIRNDHRTVKELFREFETASGNAAKKAIVDNAIVELQIHSMLEEEIFYPAVKREGGTTDILAEAEAEHHAADVQMDELTRMDAGDAQYDASFKVLVESVLHHMEEEESMVLPKAAEMGRERLERLGEQLAARRQGLLDGRRTATRARTSPGSRSGSTSGAARKRPTASRTASGAKASTSRSRSATASRSKSTANGRKASTSKRSPATTGRSRAGTRPR